MSGDQLLTLAVAMIAATAALVGAAIAAVSAGRRQRRDLRYARVLADVAELRSVLDVAAQVLVRTERCMKTTKALWSAGGISDEARSAVREASEAILDCSQRIRIRMGSGAVQIAYNEAVCAQNKCQQILFEGPASTEASREYVDAATKFEAARETFFEAAYRTVRSQADD